MQTRVINPWTRQDRFGFMQARGHRAERTLHCSGQTSVDGDGRPQHAGDVQVQAMRALDNLKTVLGEAGYAVSDMVRLTI
jgi:enamine deaminase RidA (YjgF/YER057c/UK114 family)